MSWRAACATDACECPSVARGLCSKHFERAVKAGTLPPRTIRRSLREWADLPENAERGQRLLDEWHDSRNGALTPDEVSPKSKIRVWWQGPAHSSHEWQASLGSRAGPDTNCPYCAGKAAAADNCLATVYPAVTAEWHPTRNGDLTPTDVTAGSGKMVWWQCPAATDHEWRTPVNHRTSRKPLPTGCPFCAGKAVSVGNSLAVLRPDLAVEWHPNLNGELTPDQVTVGSGKQVWWVCLVADDHVWRAAVGSRAVRGSGCLACAGRKASTTNSLAALAPEVAAQWHPTLNGTLTPDQVTVGSGKRIWWRCPIAEDHVWKAVVRSRVVLGSGCLCCAGRQASVTNSLASLFPDIAADMDPEINGGLTPADVPAGSGKAVWWRCPNNPDHTWRAVVAIRTRQRTGCPGCALTGYDKTRAGWLYVLAGDEWAKLGITNHQEKRYRQHDRHGLFGVEVAAHHFENGTMPPALELALLHFIRARSLRRVPESVPGFSESFPAELVPAALAELDRLLSSG